VNAGDMFERTALHWAIKADQPDMVDALLQYGADITVADRFDKTPLMQAAKSNRPELLKRFLTLGAFGSDADRLHRQPVCVTSHHHHHGCRYPFVRASAGLTISISSHPINFHASLHFSISNNTIHKADFKFT